MMGHERVIEIARQKFRLRPDQFREIEEKACVCLLEVERSELNEIYFQIEYGAIDFQDNPVVTASIAKGLKRIAQLCRKLDEALNEFANTPAGCQILSRFEPSPMQAGILPGSVAGRWALYANNLPTQLETNRKGQTYCVSDDQVLRVLNQIYEMAKCRLDGGGQKKANRVDFVQAFKAVSPELTRRWQHHNPEALEKRIKRLHATSQGAQSRDKIRSKVDRSCTVK